MIQAATTTTTDFTSGPLLIVHSPLLRSTDQYCSHNARKRHQCANETARPHLETRLLPEDRFNQQKDAQGICLSPYGESHSNLMDVSLLEKEAPERRGPNSLVDFESEKIDQLISYQPESRNPLLMIERPTPSDCVTEAKGADILVDPRQSESASRSDPVANGVIQAATIGLPVPSDLDCENKRFALVISRLWLQYVSRRELKQQCLTRVVMISRDLAARTIQRFWKRRALKRKEKVIQYWSSEFDFLSLNLLKSIRVYLAGDFTTPPWQERIEMKFSEASRAFACSVKMTRPGVFRGKFLIGDEWKTCDGYAVEKNEEGFVNNVFIMNA